MWKTSAGAAACLALLSTALAFAPLALSEEEPASVAPVKVGEKVRDFTMTDLQGRPFRLSQAGHTRKEIEASVLAGAAKFGAGAEAALSTALAALPGLKGEGGLDPEKRAALANEVGSFYGMTANGASAGGFGTLADLADWIEAGVKGPIVFIVWSPRCPTVIRQHDRIVEFAANAKVRTYAIACNTRDSDDQHASYCKERGFPIRVFPDREQQVTDILGGKTTPHFFLVGSDGVLRYRGAIDDDAMGLMKPEERSSWLLDALKAVRAGKDVPRAETDSAG